MITWVEINVVKSGKSERKLLLGVTVHSDGVLFRGVEWQYISRGSKR
jgi:hypothetical protein